MLLGQVQQIARVIAILEAMREAVVSVSLLFGERSLGLTIDKVLLDLQRLDVALQVLLADG